MLSSFRVLLAIMVFARLSVGSELEQQNSSESGVVAYYSVTSESWIPYWIVEADSISGILSDVMIHLDGRLSVPIKPAKPVPLKRAKHLFSKGEIQIECCVNPVWRESTGTNDYAWSDALLESREVLVFRRGEEFDFKQLKDLEGRDIATVLGYGYVGDDYFNRVDVVNNRAQLRMLERGRVDAAIFDFHEFSYLHKQYPELSGLISSLTIGPVINRSKLKMRVHTSRESLLPEINQLIRKMKNTGELARIVGRYQ